LIEHLPFQNFPSTIFIVLKQQKNVTDQANIQSAETEPWSLNMATIRLAHPQCAAGMQSIYETNAAATTAE